MTARSVVPTGVSVEDLDSTDLVAFVFPKETCKKHPKNYMVPTGIQWTSQLAFISHSYECGLAHLGCVYTLKVMRDIDLETD